MSDTKALATIDTKFSNQELALIKETVARNATPPEFNLFLYRCQKMGLDPLKNGQVHFVKYGNNPGSVIVGIEGFRSIAARTKKHIGTKRGVLRDEGGKAIGAWAEVYRKEWKHPARCEISFAEYDTGKGQWQNRRETMAQKTAEVHALRMAFPDELGGLYSEEERDVSAPLEPDAKTVEAQAAIENTEARPEFEQNIEVLPAEPERPRPAGSTPADYVFKTGNASRKGKPIDDVDLNKVQAFVDWYAVESLKEDKALHPDVVEDFEHASAYLKTLEGANG